jgi:hypothetical protein
MSTFSNYSTSELLGLLKDAVTDTTAGIKRAADILLELKSRGECHPFTRSGTLRYFAEISDGRLTPLAALVLGEFPSIIKKIIGLPADQQDSIASGAPIPVAEMDNIGNMVTTEKNIMRMTPREIETVFDGSSIRDVKAQQHLVRRASIPVARTSERPRIPVDVAGGRLIFGNMKVGVEELRAPMRELGFKIVRM